MTHQVLWRQPTTEAEWLHWRTSVITSTEAPALFGCSPYLTRFELWHNKSGTQVTEFHENDRIKWGKRLEPVIAAGIAEDEGWNVRPLKQFAVLADERAGSSFDFQVVDPVRGPGVLEIKNVDGLEALRKWLPGEDGEIEAPAHIEIQLQHQLWVSGFEWGVIAALVGGNRPLLVRRARDPAVCRAIAAAVAEFWRSIEAKTPPAPNFVEDADAISALYAYAEPNKVADLRANTAAMALCMAYKEAAAAEKCAKEQKEACKAELLTIIQDSESALLDGFKISASVVAEAEIAYTRKAYRNFRVTETKAKGEKK